MMMEDYKVTLTLVEDIYKAHSENGASEILLDYRDWEEKLYICVKCCDDCEPYYSISEEFDCTLKNWSILLYYIVNGQFVDECTGRQYSVRLAWDW